MEGSTPPSLVPKTTDVGKRVIAFPGKPQKVGHGVLRYIGIAQFAEGVWCGIELNAPRGKNDGSVGGIRYFQCKADFGLFVPLTKVKLEVSHPMREGGVLPSTLLLLFVFESEYSGDSITSSSVRT